MNSNSSSIPVEMETASSTHIINLDNHATTISTQENTISQKKRCKKWLHRQWIEIFYIPKGVRPRHFFIVKWLGRIGFIAKGILYAVMGGLCIRTAQKLVGEITGTESPMVKDSMHYYQYFVDLLNLV